MRLICWFHYFKYKAMQYIWISIEKNNLPLMVNVFTGIIMEKTEKSPVADLLSTSENNKWPFFLNALETKQPSKEVYKCYMKTQR